ncbi:Uncharacterised protein [Mycobacteroides abscessus subsp. massiliense]|nr:Uncharacterised protein [Mycobacteroides abscessus subsp. massiliense]
MIRLRIAPPNAFVFLLESAKGLVGIGLTRRQSHQPGKLEMLAGDHLPSAATSRELSTECTE